MRFHIFNASVFHVFFLATKFVLLRYKDVILWLLRTKFDGALLVLINIFDSEAFFSRVLRDSSPRFVGPSVSPSVGPSIRHTLLFLGVRVFWLHCSCPNDLVASITDPAHPHATGVAVYSALFLKTCVRIHNFCFRYPFLNSQV